MGGLMLNCVRGHQPGINPSSRSWPGNASQVQNDVDSDCGSIMLSRVAVRVYHVLHVWLQEQSWPDGPTIVPLNRHLEILNSGARRIELFSEAKIAAVRAVDHSEAKEILRTLG